MNEILYDYVCEELEDVERDGLKAGNLESTDKLVNIKKNLLKIEKLESEMDGEYSMDDGYWMAEGSYDDGMSNRGSYARGGNSYRGGSYRGGSYARGNQGGGYSSARRGEHYVRGHYSRAESMDDGMSYRGGYSSRRRDSRGRYSRDDGKESMMEHLRQMMDEAQTDKERKVVEEAMAKMEKA